jgi:hypothetical protein
MKNSSGKIDAPTEQAEIEGLKRYGWSDAEIASMTPAQRRREFQEATEIDDFLLREQAADHAATAPPPRPEGGEEVAPRRVPVPHPAPSRPPLVGHRQSRLRSRR